MRATANKPCSMPSNEPCSVGSTNPVVAVVRLVARTCATAACAITTAPNATAPDPAAHTAAMAATAPALTRSESPGTRAAPTVCTMGPTAKAPTTATTAAVSDIDKPSRPSSKPLSRSTSGIVVPSAELLTPVSVFARSHGHTRRAMRADLANAASRGPCCFRLLSAPFVVVVVVVASTARPPRGWFGSVGSKSARPAETMEPATASLAPR
mmetsp:Transcript_509/g.1969  ORF Transcript_509/g.1969 Transcript_509/m.1969 type:complete len:211 (+) Transcript_509:371-1003(+)